MIAEIDGILKREGYGFLKVLPEEAGVYYKYERGTVQVVIGILDHDGFYMGASMYAGMKEHIRERFFLPKEPLFGMDENMPVYRVDILCLVVTDELEKYRGLCSEIPGVWLLEKDTGRLIIYENQMGDFYGLAGKIQEIRPMRQTSATQKAGREETQVQKERYVPLMSAGLVLTNVMVWLFLTVLGDTNDAGFLLEHGAMYPPALVSIRQWYRIFTGMFIHIGSLHLINNMVVLYFTGEVLERETGRVRFLILYLASGIGGSLLSLYFMTKSGHMAVSAGSSGAIFGIIGALLCIALRNKGKIGTLTTKGLLIMTALCLYFGFTATGVDNWCHIGGLLTGFLLACVICHGNRRKD